MAEKFYFIYKITNKINGRYYYGKHCTYNMDDGYMGSGIAIQKAVEKYGVQNFEKKILKFYNSDDELCVAESRLVSKEYLEHHPECYNMKPGGKGGFPPGLWKGRKRSEENRLNLSKALLHHEVTQETIKKIQMANTGRKKSADEIERQRTSIKNTLAKKGIWNKGKKCPQLSGMKNGGYKALKGTHYFNNGIVETRAFECPKGFTRGRLNGRRRTTD